MNGRYFVTGGIESGQAIGKTSFYSQRGYDLNVPRYYMHVEYTMII